MTSPSRDSHFRMVWLVKQSRHVLSCIEISGVILIGLIPLTGMKVVSEREKKQKQKTEIQSKLAQLGNVHDKVDFTP